MKLKILETSFENKIPHEIPEPIVTKKAFTTKHLFVVGRNDVIGKFQGFGGALTEAAAYNFSLLSIEEREKAFRLLFTPEGLNYSWLRMSIHSCDFSLESYDYLGGTNDLANFSMKHDEKYIFPMLEEIEKAAGKKMRIFASPWSPCAYMKDNAEMAHGGHLMPFFVDEWAEYLCLYLEEMKRRDHAVECISMQNEPEADQIWESCLYSAKEEAQLVRALHGKLKYHGLDTKIYIWDHNRDHMANRVITMMSNEELRDMVDGFAYHWYYQSNSYTIQYLKRLYPDKTIGFTEGCVEFLVGEGTNKDEYGIFHHGEIYAKNISKDLRCGTQFFIDWNLILDAKGGPNHVGNFCGALMNQIDGKLVCNPSYSYVYHYAHFIEEGDDIVVCATGDTILYVLAARKKNGKLVLVICNDNPKSEKAEICVKGEYYFGVTVRPHSIQTIYEE
ncbi:MAG: hypothetical protein K5694_07125 [Bacilli bacterium]|nr:hypothetical protein [Bacilli bacterium]